MTRQEHLTLVIAGIRDIKQTTENIEITEYTLLKDELGLDSLDIVELQMWVEENSNILVRDPEGPIITVKDILDLL
jgi:acyl carrier protein